MRHRKAAQKNSRTKRLNGTPQVVPNGSKSLHAEKLKFRIAELESLKVKLEKKLVELESAVACKRESRMVDGNTLANLSRPTFDYAIETRCQNLRSTLIAIQRDRLAAQIELAISLHD